MEAWVECGGQFIKADVVRWKQAVFEERRRGRKPAFLGEREIVAEVLGEPDAEGFVSSSAIAASSRPARRPAYPIPRFRNTEAEIRRQKKTLLKNGLHRLAWEDEAARAVVACRFLSD